MLQINNKILADLEKNLNSQKKNNLWKFKEKINWHLNWRVTLCNMKISKESNIKDHICFIEVNSVKLKEKCKKNIWKYIKINLKNKNKINKQSKWWINGLLGRLKWKNNIKRDYKMVCLEPNSHLVHKNLQKLKCLAQLIN